MFVQSGTSSLAVVIAYRASVRCKSDEKWIREKAWESGSLGTWEVLELAR